MQEIFKSLNCILLSHACEIELDSSNYQKAKRAALVFFSLADEN